MVVILLDVHHTQVRRNCRVMMHLVEVGGGCSYVLLLLLMMLLLLLLFYNKWVMESCSMGGKEFDETDHDDVESWELLYS